MPGRPLNREEISAIVGGRMTRKEHLGRRVEDIAKAMGPQTFQGFRILLGSPELPINESAARGALDWAKKRRLDDEDPFLCVRVPYSKIWMYGFRSQFEDVEMHLLREAKYLATRASGAADTAAHALRTTGPVQASMTPKDRDLLGRLLVSLGRNLGAVESVVQELELVLGRG